MIRTPAIATALLLASSQAIGGPPFLTDDPVPVDYRYSELNVYAAYDDIHDGRDTSFPAMEFNYGGLRDVQLHIGIPFARSVPDGGPNEQGIGDVEVGVKYRLVHESETLPQIAVYPMAVLPTGDANKGLGNGRTWWRLPVWLQKSWGDWTSYGGGGYVINPATGQRNYAFGGWLLQKDLSQKWMLGGEVFASGRDTEAGQGTTILNLGGAYRFSHVFNLLFSAGRSVSGETHTIAYLGLWWSFGGDEPQQVSTSTSAGDPWSLSQRSGSSLRLPGQGCPIP
jgi:hypothetical protein